MPEQPGPELVASLGGNLELACSFMGLVDDLGRALRRDVARRHFRQAQKLEEERLAQLRDRRSRERLGGGST